MWKVCVNEKIFLLTNKLTNSYEDINLKKKRSIKVWSSLHIFHEVNHGLNKRNLRGPQKQGRDAH